MKTEMIIQIWEDLNTERSGHFRAFWCESADSDSGSPVIGYCSPGGTHKTIRAAAWEARRLNPRTPIYRFGKELLKLA